MIDNDKLFEAFEKQAGVLKTSELRELGLSSRQISRLIESNVIAKLKHGFYERVDVATSEDVIIAKLFPDVILFLESALFYYGYTDRIPSAWQIAVDRDQEKSIYKIEYPRIKPYYQERKFLEVGVTHYVNQGVHIKIYDRERTLCDVLRFEKKLEKEVYANAIKRYISDSKKNIGKLFEYAYIFNIAKKVQSQIGIWI